MATTAHAGWRTSTYSGSSGGNCVEVRPGTRVGVRDTKNRNRGQLAVPATAWAAFTSAAATARL